MKAPPPLPCPACTGALSDDSWLLACARRFLEGRDDELQLRAGDISMCYHCGAILVYDDGPADAPAAMRARFPNELETVEIITGARGQIVRGALIARQLDRQGRA